MRTTHQIIINQLEREQARLRRLLADNRDGMTFDDVIEINSLSNEVAELERTVKDFCERLHDIQAKIDRAQGKS